MSLLTDLDPDVVYPATESVPDSGLHSTRRYLVFGALRNRFADRADCWVGEDRNIYYREGDPRVVVAPDVFVTFGVDGESLEWAVSYRVWEVGAAPAFVLEIASEKTVRQDLNVKPAKYLEMGVQEYWRFDPTGGEFYAPALQAERRVGSCWEPIEIARDEAGRLTGHSRALDLGLHAEAQRLRFRDPVTGGWLLDPDEQVEARSAAEDRARHAEDRARHAEAELAALKARLSDPSE